MVVSRPGNLGDGYLQRADLHSLRAVFEKYASVRQGETLFLSYEDLIVRYLGLLPEGEYNKDTLDLYAGVVDQTKDKLISFSEFVSFEAHLCHPDALYRTAFQLFDRDGRGTVGFPEFESIMKKTTCIPFDMNGSFTQLYFGKARDREVSLKQLSQFLHDYHARYSKYLFKAFDHDGTGVISTDDFCDMIFSVKNHLLTGNVKKVLRPFVRSTQGEQVSYAYVTAFQSVLANIEDAKTVYNHASGGSKTLEVSKDSFLHAGQTLSKLTPLEVEILFSLSDHLHDSPTLIYSDLQNLAPEQYMKQVTKRLVDIRLVERPEDRNSFIAFLEFVYRVSIGSISGVISASGAYPIDLVKTRLMNQRNLRVYEDSLDCVTKVTRLEGVRGLYRGLSLQLVAVATGSATQLGINDFLRDKLTTATHGHMSVVGEVVAGAIAGAAKGVLSSPLELLKIRMQVAGQFSPHRYWGFDKKVSVWREMGGLQNMFRGCGATVLRDMPFGAVYFPAYHHIKVYLADQTGYNSPTSIFLSGALAGTIASSLNTPLDMVKTRLQVLPRPGQTSYNGIQDAVQKIYKEEGVRAFWKGGVAKKMRAAKYGVTMFTYELVQRILFIDFGGSRPSGSQREATSGSAGLHLSGSVDHIGGYAVATPIFNGIESKFGLRFPKTREKLM